MNYKEIKLNSIENAGINLFIDCDSYYEIVDFYEEIKITKFLMK